MKNQLDTRNKELLIYETETLTIQILGGIKLSGLERLRVTLKLVAKENHSYPLRFSCDAYNTDQVERLIHRITDHFELEISMVRKTLMGLIDELENYRLTELDKYQTKSARELSEEETKAAIDYLKNPKLMDQLTEDIPHASKVVGEPINSMLLYVIFSSKRQPVPLSTIIFGESGSGKTTLLQGIASLFPEEDQVSFTSLSRNSLYYMEDLTDKLLLIEDLKGISNDDTLFALRELISNQKLSRSVTERNFKGETTSKTKVLHTQVSVGCCTTDQTVYYDNQNRSIPIYIDGWNKEREDQIRTYKKQLSAGKIDQRANDELRNLLQNAQTLLQPISVRNPYAEYLTLPDTVKSHKRSLQLYLSFIATIAWLHQYSRKVKREGDEKYIMVTQQDIKWANKLLYKALLSRSDELSTATRRFHQLLRQTLSDKTEDTFTIREIKHLSHLSNVKRYLKELRSYEYLQIVNGSKYRGYTYKLTKDNTWEELQKQLEKRLNPTSLDHV